MRSPEIEKSLILLQGGEKVNRWLIITTISRISSQVGSYPAEHRKESPNRRGGGGGGVVEVIEAVHLLAADVDDVGVCVGLYTDVALSAKPYKTHAISLWARNQPRIYWRPSLTALLNNCTLSLSLSPLQRESKTTTGQEERDYVR